ncbi:vacuole effluxer Atg22 like-domain-containing protein [Russula vinacea]|nr:vacuole effluxer Atg22 like-domain-containing protein [Russula vinacea]
MHTFRYLTVWFFLSDGFTTLTLTALFVSKTALDKVHTVYHSALSLSWTYSHQVLTSLRVLILLIIAASVILLYGVIKLFAPRGARWGLRVPVEIFVLAVYFGGLYGAFQSYARVLYPEIIPLGEEARWYGLFCITDKSSSFIGPLVVGLVADLTGNIRYAFLFVVIMLWADSQCSPKLTSNVGGLTHRLGHHMSLIWVGSRECRFSEALTKL